jgi:hypothetical protein
MSYCQFENTANDLQQCLNALKDGELPESETEKEGLVTIATLARELLEEVSYIEQRKKEAVSFER